SLIWKMGMKTGSGGRPPPSPHLSSSRVHRHADAIFTNSYRKVLGQISARKLLQRLGEGRPEEEEEAKREAWRSRRWDGIPPDGRRRAGLRDFPEAPLGARRWVGSPRGPCPEGRPDPRSLPSNGAPGPRPRPPPAP
uniref:Somatoliberin n=1 Tax=Ornithorhynchus anatinus TaxID=9258 RepID=A0A6I8NYG8_ORNAN